MQIKPLVRRLTYFGLLIAFTGCATHFTGSAHVTKPSCQSFCQKNGLHFSGMVALGEYSSGCICSASRNPASDEVSLNSSGAGAAAVGVVSRMRAAQQAAAAAAAN